ncbi:hypothetical protein BDV34DRAFT_198208 [Aspergillus parasiticus]|uniref:Uncharacterized protein n=1 Tax=Aspergillus parasiticus TaxID=5067 RepID=A0A5N6DFL1_ASPPA|nr:hypothetical protein BDV34DRAFT_198208 [Aspergillus parasiticus]
MNGLLKQAIMLPPLSHDQHPMAHCASQRLKSMPRKAARLSPRTPAGLDPEAKTFTNPLFETVSPGGYRLAFSLGYLCIVYSVRERQI